MTERRGIAPDQIYRVRSAEAAVRDGVFAVALRQVVGPLSKWPLR
jgi:hypothetical protein